MLIANRAPSMHRIGVGRENSQPEDHRSQGPVGSGCRPAARARPKIVSGVFRTPNQPKGRRLVKARDDSVGAPYDTFSAAGTAASQGIPNLSPEASATP